MAQAILLTCLLLAGAAQAAEPPSPLAPAESLFLDFLDAAKAI